VIVRRAAVDERPEHPGDAAISSIVPPSLPRIAGEAIAKRSRLRSASRISPIAFGVASGVHGVGTWAPTAEWRSSRAMAIRIEFRARDLTPCYALCANTARTRRTGPAHSAPQQKNAVASNNANGARRALRGLVDQQLGREPNRLRRTRVADIFRRSPALQSLLSTARITDDVR
jgi:hypothetical protein